MTLREARLIVPQNDSDNRPAGTRLAKVRNLLVLNFSGYTEKVAIGACVMLDKNIKTEMVHVFDIAVDYDPLIGDTGSISHTLRTIARIALNEMDQESVYLRHASGVIEFVKRSRDQAAA